MQLAQCMGKRCLNTAERPGSVPLPGIVPDLGNDRNIDVRHEEE